jgi:hypothetical protein
MRKRPPLARRGQIWRLIATWHRRSRSPGKTGQRAGDVLLAEHISVSSQTRLQIAAPGVPNGWKQQYGLAFGSPQARKYSSNAICAGPNASRSDPSKDSHSCPTKTRSRAVSRAAIQQANRPHLERPFFPQDRFPNGSIASLGIVNRMQFVEQTGARARQSPRN